MDPLMPVVYLVVSGLLACNAPEPIEVVEVVEVQAAPAGDVSLAHAQQKVELLGREGDAGDIDGDGLVDVVTLMFPNWGALLGSGEVVVPADLPARVDDVAVADLAAEEGDEIVLAYQTPPPPPTRVAASSHIVEAYRLGESLPFAVLVHAAAELGDSYRVTTLHRPVSDDADGLIVSGETATWLLYSVPEWGELDEDARTRLDGTDPSAVTSGDLDGDGRGDAVVVVNGDAIVLLDPEPGSWFGVPDAAPVLALGGTFSLASGGDIDGDGTDDLAAVADAAYLFLGPHTEDRDAQDAAATLVAREVPLLSPQQVALASDLDGDGFDDWLVSSTDEVAPGVGGVVAVWYGPASGSRSFSEADARLLGESAGARTGELVLGPGDTDGDGYGDLVATSGGALYVLRGGPRL